MFQGSEYVYAVYREKSFSKAAKKLFISQPSLSANVRRVEQRIGAPIFDRKTKPLQLTHVGEEYIHSVERIDAIEKEFESFVNDLNDFQKGRLLLGGSNFFSSWVLPPLMEAYSRRFPHIELGLLEENTARLEQLLLDGSVDLLLDYELRDETHFEKRLYKEEHLVLAVPAAFAENDGLAAYRLTPEMIRSGQFLDREMPCVPLEVFRSAPFILLKPENSTRHCAVRICREAGLVPNILYELDQQMTSYNITSSGQGISFIGDTLVSSVADNPRIVCYKLPPELAGRGIYFFWKRGRYRSRALEAFLDVSGA